MFNLCYNNYEVILIEGIKADVKQSYSAWVWAMHDRDRINPLMEAFPESMVPCIFPFPLQCF